MNDKMEKLLKECESTRLYGIVEIHYMNGIPGHMSVKRTYKLQSTDGNFHNEETRRGASNGSQQAENRNNR